MQEAFSREVLGGVLILFLFVRIFFTIMARVSGDRNPQETNVVVPEPKLNFIVRRWILVPAIAGSIFFLYNKPSWMRLFSLALPEWGIVLGGVLGFCGIILLFWVHVVLGRHWSAKMQLRTDHLLIQTGPYSGVRHPMYTALFTIYLSVGIVSSNYVILLLMAMAVVSLRMRVPKEEEMLVERFGESYRTYMKNAGRFFPKI